MVKRPDKQPRSVAVKWKAGDSVRFAHQQANGPDHRVADISKNGEMVELEDMTGLFAAHIFVRSPIAGSR
jgi:hypothetical protein